MPAHPVESGPQLGTLIAMAKAGTPDEKLILMSGHKTAQTLYRYLAWGRYNVEARDALQRTAEATL